MRTGLIAKKIGMTRIFKEDGNHAPVTVLKVDNCQVVSVQTEERNGYVSLQLGSGKAKVKNVTKPMRGHYAKAKVEPKQKLAEFRVSNDAVVEVGKEITANHFISGQYVDVTGVTIGKGFAGAMKRHNFGGLRATHGVSISHRSHGSTGQCQDPGRVFKGKRMAGHMGNTQQTAQNLEVISIDAEKGLIFVQGAVPGSKGGWVTISDATKKAAPEGVPFPAGLREMIEGSKPSEEAPVEDVVDTEVVNAAEAAAPVEEVKEVVAEEVEVKAEATESSDDNEKKE